MNEKLFTIWRKIVDAVKKKPSYVFHFLGHSMFIVSFFSDFVSKYFFLVMICFVIAFLIEKKYKNIVFMVSIYSLFWIVRVFVGGFFASLLTLVLFSYLFFAIAKNFKAVLKDAERDKDVFILKTLERLQHKETPYMKYLRDKLGKGKNETDITKNI